MNNDFGGQGHAVLLSADQFQRLSRSATYDAVAVAQAIVESAEESLNRRFADHAYLDGLRTALESAYTLRTKLEGADLEKTEEVLAIFDPLLEKVKLLQSV